VTPGARELDKPQALPHPSAMDMLEGESRVRDYGLERQMMLSDGVFAIAMTLLVLDLRVPAGWDGTAIGLIAGAGAQFFGYVMSFFTISLFWAIHRQSYGRFLKTDFMLSALGLATLSAVSLIPFATRIYSENLLEARNGAIRFYLGVFCLGSVFSALSWGYACLKPGIMEKAIGPRAKVVVFLITLTATPLMTGLGVIGGALQQWWMFPVMGLVGAVIGLIRRWATKADQTAASEPAQ
jgi:uncharacterized membrane protein